jgi:hypothetical protein
MVFSTEQYLFDNTSRPKPLEFGEYAEDNTAITSRPIRQVDYLSYKWNEEDIWLLWRYMLAYKGEFANGIRLKNALWRTWIKTKNNLKTISPESLN